MITALLRKHNIIFISHDEIQPRWSFEVYAQIIKCKFILYQIYYLDDHDVISWVLYRTNPEIEGREKILQCAQSTHSNGSEKANSCFSASAIFLKAGDKLAVRNTGGDRHSLMQPEKSFIGLIKLADAEDPNQELQNLLYQSSFRGAIVIFKLQVTVMWSRRPVGAIVNSGLILP